jgi:hypothetical protein
MSTRQICDPVLLSRRAALLPPLLLRCISKLPNSVPVIRRNLLLKIKLSCSSLTYRHRKRADVSARFKLILEANTEISLAKACKYLIAATKVMGIE